MAETISTHRIARFRCPDCGNKYISLPLLLKHVATIHKDKIPYGVSPKQYCFNRRNNKEFQLCVICKKNHTKWNEDTGHYDRFCSTTCRQKAGQLAEENLKRKTGKGRKERMESDETQRDMLKQRSISGSYTFRDKKTTLDYVGSYELDFLRFYDEDMNGDPLDIIECPFTFNYIYDDELHFYIPDFYIPTLNLIIEIKDGGNNPNTHPKILAVDKVKEQLKDKAVIDSKKFNFCKIYNKEYDNFLNVVSILKDRNGSYDNFSPIISI